MGGIPKKINKFMPQGFFIVIFALEEERSKKLQGGIWRMGLMPLYIHFECWTEEILEKTRRT